MKTRFLVYATAITFTVALPLFAASSPKGGILYTFKGGSDGQSPVAPLVADAQGNLYGTTQAGGGGMPCDGSTEGCGTVFELIAPSSPSGAWREKILYAFTGQADGEVPTGGLILDSAGNLYGTTEGGGDLGSTMCGNPIGFGCGVVFELSPPSSGGPWTETVLYTFEGLPDGAFPETALVFDKAGNLYGTTVLGGTENAGAIFELSPQSGGTWAESIIYSFMGSTDGELPISSLIFDTSGNFYGATVDGVYQLTPPGNGGEWSLNAIGVFEGGSLEYFHAGLLFDPSGNLFVTDPGGAPHVNGQALEFIPPHNGGTWTEIVIYSFRGGGDAEPFGFAEDSSGNLYGTTLGNAPNVGGEVFKLSDSANGWNRTVLHSFSNTRFSQGNGPQAPLVYGKWEALFGTTSQGGDKSCGTGCGTVFGFLPQRKAKSRFLSLAGARSE
jgi:uncharacterized repeat protein (TIGR03803 family)